MRRRTLLAVLASGVAVASAGCLGDDDDDDDDDNNGTAPSPTPGATPTPPAPLPADPESDAFPSAFNRNPRGEADYDLPVPLGDEADEYRDMDFPEDLGEPACVEVPGVAIAVDEHLREVFDLAFVPVTHSSGAEALMVELDPSDLPDHSADEIVASVPPSAVRVDGDDRLCNVPIYVDLG